MNIAVGKIQFTEEELELLEQINPELKLRVLSDPGFEAPLSYPQRRIWLAQQMHPGAHYNDHIDLRLTGPLNVTCLEAAWNQVVLQNETLRTAIVQPGDEPCQRVMPYTPAELPVVDLRRFDDPFNEATRRCVALGNTLLDLASSDVFRICLFRLADEDHILHLTVHHIAIDDWSWHILQRELKQFYEAARAGRLGVLRAQNKLRYTEFARCQREQLDGNVISEQLSYWKTQLKDAPIPLELPTDFPRPARPTFRGRKEQVSFDRGLTESLKRFSREQNGTLFMTVLAALKTLLWRYTGGEDVVVGTPMANRIALEHRDVIGCFVNLLPLRTKISSDVTVKQFLQRVQKVALGAYAHQDLPFEKMVEDLQPPREQNQNPLFEVALTLQNAPVGISNIGEVSVNEIELDYQWSKFDLTVNLTETASGLSGWIEYSTHLFEPTTVRRMASHLDVVLRTMPHQQEHRISELPVFTASERNQIVVEWNRTNLDFPRDKCAHELFEQQVRENPGADAITFKHTTWTYHELNARADGVAQRLRDARTSPGSLVGVCVERSAEMVAVLLGIWKAASAYVPLDPSHPPERNKDICLDARVSVVITNKDFAPKFAATNLRLLFVEDIADAVQSRAKAAPSFFPEDLAYVMYTSGSTGRPKGVQIRHRSVTNMLTGIGKTTGFTKQDHLLAVTTITFDISLLELFLPLTTGAKLTVVEREVTMDGVKLAKLADHATTTVMQATPATWRMLVEAGWKGNPQLTIFCGGEALTASLAQELLPRAKTVWNLYGPTEVTVWCTGWKVEKGKRICIGRPFGNTQAYILDKHLQPVPVGVVGELYFGGEGLAAGYLNRPDLTAEKFIPNPLKHENVIYNTGDLARYLPDGSIECLGRVDHQLKIRGYRIEAGEIEAVLAQHPAVQQAVVIASDDSSGTKSLTAYVIKHTAVETDSSALIQFLQSKLPSYMVPAEFVFTEKFPLTSSGKIDRKQLSKLPSQTRCVQPGTAPQTDIEQYLAQIWSGVLGREQIGRADNFFQIGGNSLLAVRLIFRLNEIFETKLNLIAVFDHPTICDLAKVVKTAQKV